MTKSQYKPNGTSLPFQEIDSITIESIDFVAFRKSQEEKIAWFKDKDFKNTKTTAEKILRIITSPKYRSGSLQVIKLEKYKDMLLENIQYFVFY